MYRNCSYNSRAKQIHLFTWDQNGSRVRYDLDFKPYLYVEDPRGDKTSIFGTKLRKKVFNSTYDRNQFVKDSGTKRLFENLSATQQFLLDNYWLENEKPEFVANPLKICYIDIENDTHDYKNDHTVKCKAKTDTSSERTVKLGEYRDKQLYETHDVWDIEQKEWVDYLKSCYALKTSFPSVEDPEHPINLITCFDSFTKQYTTFGLKQLEKEIQNVDYVFCRSEKELFHRFVEYLEEDYPDIVSGWNSTGYDIPYIVKRAEKILGEDFVKRFSPIDNVYSRTFMGKFGKEVKRYYFDGIACLDYLEIYQRFCLEPRESFKLNSIAELELGEQKVDYGDISLAILADTDWQKFVEYNIQDVNLIIKLENKLQYIDLLRMLAYTGLTTLEGAMGSTSTVTGALVIQARNRSEVLSTFIKGDSGVKIPGGYVAEPVSGFAKNIVSFDANSLYPNIMISLNLSPETKVGKFSVEGDTVIVHHVSGKKFELTKSKFSDFLKKEQLSISKASVLFSQKKKGVIPEFLEGLYKKRIESKDIYTKIKKEIDTITKKDKKADITQLNYRKQLYFTKQLTQKILLNSVYGLTGDMRSPIGDEDIASSVTQTGQSVIKQSGDIIVEYLTNRFVLEGVKKEDVIKYQDTDSYVGDTQVVTDKGTFDAESLWFEYQSPDQVVTTFGHDIQKVSNLNVMAYDKESDKIKFRSVKNLIRHKVSKGKYKINVGNKSITMTEDHGCMIFRDGEMLRVSAKDIKKGDKMMITRSNGVSYILVDVDSVEQLDDFQDEYVYDLEMTDSSQPWFFANDILIHNSCYVSLDPIKDTIPLLVDNKINDKFYSIVRDIENKLNSEIKIWCQKYLRSTYCTIAFKRECIADIGIFLMKKRYILHVLDDEGIIVDKFKYTGVEVVRSTMPNAIKPYAKKIIETMIRTQSVAKTNELINDTYRVFRTLPAQDIAFVKGIKNYEAYTSKCKGFETAKGTPNHVKSAYHYNLLLKKHNIDNKYESIASGDKMRVIYVQQPNKYGINTIGFKSMLPAEFATDFTVDYEIMFEKILYSMIDRLYSCVNWSIRKPTENVRTELFDLFS